MFRFYHITVHFDSDSIIWIWCCLMISAGRASLCNHNRSISWASPIYFFSQLLRWSVTSLSKVLYNERKNIRRTRTNVKANVTYNLYLLDLVFSLTCKKGFYHYLGWGGWGQKVAGGEWCCISLSSSVSRIMSISEGAVFHEVKALIKEQNHIRKISTKI